MKTLLLILLKTLGIHSNGVTNWGAVGAWAFGLGFITAGVITEEYLAMWFGIVFCIIIPFFVWASNKS